MNWQKEIQRDEGNLKSSFSVGKEIPINVNLLRAMILTLESHIDHSKREGGICNRLEVISSSAKETLVKR